MYDVISTSVEVGASGGMKNTTLEELYEWPGAELLNVFVYYQ